MKIISHRGNIRGPVPGRENAPSYIDCALGNGYDVEIDVWLIHGEYWLGHDEPQYKVTWNWIFHRQDNLWLHCKNVEAAKSLRVFQSFCHTGDPYSYTSHGKVWLHDLSQKIDDNTIIPLLSVESVVEYKSVVEHKDRLNDAYGICTDYPSII